MKVKVSDLRDLIREEVENLMEETSSIPSLTNQFGRLRESLYDWVKNARLAVELYEEFEKESSKHFGIMYSVEHGDPRQGGAKPQETTQGREELNDSIRRLTMLLNSMENSAGNATFIANINKNFKEGLRSDLQSIVKEAETQEKASHPAEPELTPAQKRAAMWKKATIPGR